jgi:hypothetical protein
MSPFYRNSDDTFIIPPLSSSISIVLCEREVVDVKEAFEEKDLSFFGQLKDFLQNSISIVRNARIQARKNNDLLKPL